ARACPLGGGRQRSARPHLRRRARGGAVDGRRATRPAARPSNRDGGRARDSELLAARLLVRIAVVTRHVHRAGGVGTYLEHVLPGVGARGHDVHVWYEFAPPPPAEGPSGILPPTMRSTHLASASLDAALATLRSWRPDLVFLHGLSDPALEARCGAMAPL